MDIASYFGELSLGALVARLPTGLSQGLVWGIFALGVFITYKLLDVADLTVDGSFATGAACTAVFVGAGYPIWVSLLAATAAGAIAGAVTGLLHTKLGIPAILSGILTQLALYSVNLHIMGKANLPVSSKKVTLALSSANSTLSIVVGAGIALLLIALLYWYFGTEQGCAMRATGSNPAMSRAQGININNMKLLGLSISNAMVAFAGSLMSQYQGFADVKMGSGAIVIGLAAVIIGEVMCESIFKMNLNFFVRMCFIVLGGVVYYLAVTLVLWLKLPTDDLKLFTAVLVAIFLAVPYLKEKAKVSFKRPRKGAENNADN